MVSHILYLQTTPTFQKTFQGGGDGVDDDRWNVRVPAMWVGWSKGVSKGALLVNWYMDMDMACAGACEGSTFAH